MRMPSPMSWYSSSCFIAPVPAGNVLDLPSSTAPERGSWILRGKYGTVDVPVGTCSTSSLPSPGFMTSTLAPLAF